MLYFARQECRAPVAFYTLDQSPVSLEELSFRRTAVSGDIVYPMLRRAEQRGRVD
jgi:hypothetical protein